MGNLDVLELDVSSKSFLKSPSSASTTGNVDQTVFWLGFTCACFTWIGFIFWPLCGPPEDVDGAVGGGGGAIEGGGGGEGEGVSVVPSSSVKSLASSWTVFVLTM